MPVMARPASALYRMQRFVTRHLLAVGAFATFIFGICIALGMAVWQRNLAVTERANAEQVRDVVISVFREADPYKRVNGTPIMPADLLSAASDRVEHALRSQPIVALELLTNIGESQFGLGQPLEAAATLETALRTSSPLEVTEPERIARVHRLLSQVYALVGRVDDADAHLDTALRMLSDRHSSPEFIELQLQRSANAVERAAFDEALDAAQLALNLARTTPDVNVQSLAQAWRYSAVVYRVRGDSARAIESYGHAFSLARQAYQHDVRHPFVMETRMGYARALMMENRWPEAYEHMRAAVDAATQTFGSEASLTANFLQSLGQLETKLGDIEAGIAKCRKALSIYERIKRHGTRGHAGQLRNLGAALLEAQRDREAATFLARAERIRAGFADPYELPATRTAYALALIRQQQLDAAEAQLNRVEEVGATLPASVAVELHLYRGMLQRHRGDYRPALMNLTQAFVMARNSINAQYMQGFALNELGAAHSALGQHETALIEHRRAAELFREVQRQPTPALADAWFGIGRALLALGKPHAAATELELVASFWRDFGSETHERYRQAAALHALAVQATRSRPMLART
jgi:tetratricopeptide (TPR) repeat protein